ncbi:osteopetrosis-associated transmembrane protein 1-like [Ostrea edulis]|uniref:osteopetrosis-associated transmembrane protein 1-like n=1 Tax=Ostrea edulis TaxID=37623 RepID=UPI0024AF603A|nr:osteopetrosis-associated transmembrane protein 1-like [Ostrea edulis]XP_056013687.1 osteopetrosis-associated transmembrane protein 1-like [Ostrea edulis]
MIQALWDASDCKNCFSSMSEDENGTVSFQFNTHTLKFLEQYDNFTDCIEKYTNGIYPDFTFINSTVCSACEHKYREPNLHFVNMRKIYNGKICMDLVDMMNYTRLMWGGERDLNCTRHLKDDMVVLLTSFILLTVPFLFYGASCICGKRRKLKLMTQKRLKKRISVEVSFVNHSETNNVNHVHS